MGATATGQASGWPRKVVERSILRTSTSTDWRMASRSRCSRFRRSVVSVSAAPSPKFHVSRGSFWRAASRISGRVTYLGGVMRATILRPEQGDNRRLDRAESRA